MVELYHIVPEMPDRAFVRVSGLGLVFFFILYNFLTLPPAPGRMQQLPVELLIFQ
jgi:hypothetical protein